MNSFINTFHSYCQIYTLVFAVILSCTNTNALVRTKRMSRVDQYPTAYSNIHSKSPSSNVHKEPCIGGDNCCKNGNCGLGEGDCDVNSDCRGDLVCGKDNCPQNGLFDLTDDCCTTPEIRLTRALPFIPIVTALAPIIPQITNFMGNLLKPLINNLSSRKGDDGHKNNLLASFIPRAFKGTNLENSETETAIKQNMREGQYIVALETLRSREKALDKSLYEPANMGKATLNGYPVVKMFSSLTHVMDNILKTRLLSLSKSSTAFISTVLEENRLIMQKEHQDASLIIGHIQVGVNKVRNTLNQQRHEPELTKVYILLTMLIILATLILASIYFIKRSLIDWMIRQQLSAARQKNFGHAGFQDDPMLEDQSDA